MRDDLTLESVPCPVASVLEEELDGELLLWHDGAMHRLDPVGAVVWRSLDGTGSLADVAADLASGFTVARADVERDLLALCARLARAGLLGDQPERPPLAPDEPTVGPGLRPGPAPLEHMAWAHTAGPFRGLAYEFAIRSTDAAIGRYLSRALGSLALAGRGAATGASRHVYSVIERPEPPAYAVYLDDLDLVAVASPDRAIRHVLWHVNTEVIRRARDHVLVHAGGAVLGDSAVVLPGPINAGKTTLVAGLVRDGFGYLTDELVALHLGTGLLDPYPRPLNLSEGSWTAVPELRPPGWKPGNPLAPRQWHVDLGAVRPGAVAAAAPPRFVIAPHFEPGAEAALEPLSRGAALELLMREAMNLHRHGDAAFRSLLDLVRRSVCARLRTGSLPGAVRLVRDVVEDHTA